MFAKIFNQIFDSSIVDEPQVRFTFIDFLILADRNGVVDMTHEAIAHRTNRPLKVIRSTIAQLEGPDPRSRTPDADGARIFRLDDHRDWGWGIVNYEYYRKLASQEQRREKTKLRVQKYRQKKAKVLRESLPVTSCNAPVTLGNDSPSPSASACTSSSCTTSSSFLGKLKDDPTYIGVDIERELQQARNWCGRKNRRLTERFFKNWLAKADRLISIAAKPSYLPPANEPTDDEREKALALARTETLKLSQQFKMP